MTTWRTVSALEATAHPLYGLRGWLLLFLLGLPFGLLVQIGQLSNALDYQGIDLSDFLRSHSASSSFARGVIAIQAVLCAVVWIAALVKASQFRTVAISAMVIGPLGVVGMATMNNIPLTTSLTPSETFGWLLSLAVWIPYIQTSKRVRVTFESTMPVIPSRPMEAPSLAPSVPPRSEQTVVEEELWAIALSEFESDTRRLGLWAKCFSESNGNESEAKAAYLRERARQLHDARQSAPE